MKLRGLFGGAVRENYGAIFALIEQNRDVEILDYGCGNGKFCPKVGREDRKNGSNQPRLLACNGLKTLLE